MMRKVHKASRIASYMGSMATVTQGAVTMVAIATTMLPGVETFGCPQTMAYQESINVSNSFIEGRGVPEPRTVSDDTRASRLGRPARSISTWASLVDPFSPELVTFL